MSTCCLPSTDLAEVQVGPSLTSSPESDAACLQQGAPDADYEQVRLEALRTLGILDTPPELELDDLVQLATTLCGAPIGLLSFVDEDRMWLKSSVGLSFTEIPRELSFCHHSIKGKSLMLVEDARQDERFRTNPLVTGDGMRFYAGMPLQTANHQVVGALCVLDYVPRTLSAAQRSALQTLASQIQVRLELRVQHDTLRVALEEARAAREQAEALERRFQTFMDSGPFLAYMKDKDGRLLYYNEQFSRVFQVSRTESLHKTDAELWPEHLAKTYRENDLEVFRSGSLQVRYEHSCSADGTKSTWRSYKFPCTGSDGKALLGGVSIEVTEELQRQIELQRSQAELKLANKHLHELASLDSLTGLANRRIFDECLQALFHRARRRAEPLSVLMLDVDRFKQHNDRFGHAHGDAVLRELAQCLKSSVRANDLVARYGGEEFAILLPGTTGKEANLLAHRLLEIVRGNSWPLSPVTVSIGVNTQTPATRDAQHLLGRADEALYAAKYEGRDRIVSYAEPLSSLTGAAHPN